MGTSCCSELINGVAGRAVPVRLRLLHLTCTGAAFGVTERVTIARAGPLREGPTGETDWNGARPRSFPMMAPAASLSLLETTRSRPMRKGGRHSTGKRKPGSRNPAPPPGIHPGASSGPGRGYGSLRRGPAHLRYRMGPRPRTAARVVIVRRHPWLVWLAIAAARRLRYGPRPARVH